MIRTISQETFEFLKKEIALWEESNILNREQGESIIASYEIKRSRGRKITFFMFFGCALLGLSLTALVGLNHLNLAQKYELLVFLTVAFGAITFQGWRLIGQTRDDRTVADAHLLLGAIIFADAIALATQMFNFTTSQNWEAIAGAVCILPIALFTRSTPLLLACNASIVMWGWATDVQPEFKIAACAVALAAAYFLRSPWAAGLALLAGPPALILGQTWTHKYTAPMALGVMLLAWHAWHTGNSRWRNMATPYLWVGLLMCTFETMQCVQNGCAESKDLIPQVVAVAACCGACLGRSRRFLFERVTALILTILLIAYPILPGTSAGENALPFILATLLVILYCVKVVDNPWYIAAPLLSTFGLMTFTNVCDLSTVCFAALIAGVITLISVMVARSRKKVSLVTLHQPQTQS